MKNMEPSHQTNEDKSTNAEVPTSSQHFGNALLCAAFSYDELISKIGCAVIDDSKQHGKLLDVMDTGGHRHRLRVKINCCSNMPYWMWADYVWLLGSA